MARKGLWLRLLLPWLSGMWEDKPWSLQGPVTKGGTIKGDGMVGTLSSSCMRPVRFQFLRVRAGIGPG